jgi:hypothetical protein
MVSIPFSIADKLLAALLHLQQHYEVLSKAVVAHHLDTEAMLNKCLSLVVNHGRC